MMFDGGRYLFTKKYFRFSSGDTELYNVFHSAIYKVLTIILTGYCLPKKTFISRADTVLYSVFHSAIYKVSTMISTGYFLPKKPVISQAARGHLQFPFITGCFDKAFPDRFMRCSFLAFSE